MRKNTCNQQKPEGMRKRRHGITSALALIIFGPDGMAPLCCVNTQRDWNGVVVYLFIYNIFYSHVDGTNP